jgi:uncharacterized protein
MKHLIVPGFLGSEKGHWQDFWLEDDPTAQLVEQDSWRNPVLSRWLRRLECEIVANPGCILVAHSLGAVLVANLAHSFASLQVAGALLVAPADVEAAQKRHPGQIDFGSMPREELPFPSILVASRTDLYMPLQKSLECARLWGSGFVDVGDAGHINVANGFGRWTEGYFLASGLGRSAEDFDVARSFPQAVATLSAAMAA